MSLRDHLQAVYDDHGKLTPQLVVDVAKPKNHPLHDRFEWDNRIAGPAYRLIQAQELIARVKVTYKPATDKEPSKTVRQWHAIRTDEPENGGYAYEPAEKIAADPLARAMLLRDMEREWQTLKRRWSEFTEFAEMIRRDLDDEAA